MKTITNYFRALVLLFGIVAAKESFSQSPCSANFTYAINPAGNVTFSSTSSNTTASTQYFWIVYASNPLGGIIGVASFTGMNTSYTFSVNGTYSMSMLMLNTSPTCTSSSMQSIVITNTTVPCNLSANVTFTQASAGNVNFTANTSGTVLGTTYFWDFDDNTTSTVMSPLHTYTADGIYTPTLTVTNSGTCSSVTTASLLVCSNNSLVPSFNYSLDPGGVVNFTSTSTGTNVNTYYTWYTLGWPFSNNYASGNNLIQPSFTFSANASYNVVLSIYNNFGCQVNTSQTITITNTLTVCNLIAGFNSSSAGPGIENFTGFATGTLSGVTYSWNFGDNTTSTSQSPSHTYAADGSYIVTFTAINNNTCTAAYTQTLQVCTVNPMSASFVYSASPGGVVNFSSTSTGTNASTYYVWSGAFYQGGTNLVQVSNTFTANTTYLVDLGIYDANSGCSAFITQQPVVVNTVPPPCIQAANFTTSSGNPGVVDFIDLSTGTLSGVSYSWDFGDNNTSTSTSPSHTYSADGYYVVTLTTTDNNNNACVSVITRTIQICEINPLIPSFNFSVDPLGAISCTSTSSGTMSPATYYWMFSSNGISWGVNLTQQAITYTTTGVYTASLTIINQLTGCSAGISQTFAVTNVAAPCNLAANFTYSSSNSSLVNFNNTSTGTLSGVSYVWNFGDNTTSTNISPSHTYGADGYYVVTLTATDNLNNTCTSTTTQTIQVCSMIASFVYSVNPSGLVNFSSTSTGTTANTFYNWGSNNISNWTMVTGTNVTQANITYTANGVYTATLGIYNSLTGCSAFASQTLVITNTACVADAGFALSPSGTPQVWYAYPSNAVNVSSAEWQWGDGSSSNTLYTSHTYSAAGLYSICLSVTVSCGAYDTVCTSYSIFKSSGTNEDLNIIQINVLDPATVGVKDNDNENNQYVISPNPNNGVFNLKGTGSGKTTITICDAMGKLVFSDTYETEEVRLGKEIDLKDVANGIYYLNVSSDKNSINKKIVVNR